ncbi:MAG: SH3 domain-containing protein [Candidatus Weimeria sp.]|nr:SH3 domain-containing protein [Candidatus Weimeria sp.]
MDKILDFVKNNKRYVAAGVVAVIMVCLLVYGVSLNRSGDKTRKESAAQYKKEQEDSNLHKLLKSYYKAYAAGDTKSLAKIADPISDEEKSYIGFMAGQIDSYDLKEVYTKKGIKDNAKLVSVYVEIHFKGLKTPAPGLDFFYVEEDEKGNLKINNLYSAYNQENGKLDMDQNIVSRIAAFEEEGDVVDLKAKVQKEFNEISLKDKKFSSYMTDTLPKAAKKWAADYKQKEAAAKKAAEKKEAEKKEAEKKAAAKKAAAKKAAEAKKKQEASKKSTKSNKKYLYTKDKVNLRKKPTVDSKVLKTLKKGKKVIKLGKSGKFYKVKVGSKTGYIHSMYLKGNGKKSSGSTSTKKVKSGKVITLSDTVNIRKRKSQRSKRIAVAYVNEQIKVVKSYDSGWSKVKYDGKTGYVKTKYLK